MTLKVYDPSKLDKFALRLLDIASVVRNMSNRSREHAIENLPLHDKKALEWCAKLEQWTHKTRADLEVKILQERAGKRAHSVVE